jgi:hypothetical protein
LILGYLHVAVLLALCCQSSAPRCERVSGRPACATHGPQAAFSQSLEGLQMANRASELARSGRELRGAARAHATELAQLESEASGLEEKAAHMRQQLVSASHAANADDVATVRGAGGRLWGADCASGGCWAMREGQGRSGNDVRGVLVVGWALLSPHCLLAGCVGWPALKASQALYLCARLARS